MKNQPEEIYLNLGDDVDCLDYNELVESEIGWSTEPCTADAIRYIRADLQDEEALTVGLRDKFAMAAMQGFCASGEYGSQFWDKDTARDAYIVADAMLKERVK